MADLVEQSIGKGVEAIVDAAAEIASGSFREARAEKAKMNKALGYWCHWFPGLQYSPKQFYTAVEQKVKELELPYLDLEPITLRQGGAGSPSRLYLRSTRDKVVFEVCAAPFGNGFFVSSRLFDRRREARWYHLLLFLFLILIPGAVAYQVSKDWIWGAGVSGGLLAFIWTLMRLAQADVMKWITRQVSNAPLIGRIYERFFNPDTFFRQDTNACYRTAVHSAVMDAIDDLTSAQGLRPLSAEDRRPMMREPWLA